MKGRYQLHSEEDADEGFDHQPNQAEQFTLHPHNIDLEPHAFHSLQPTTHKKTNQKASEKHALKLDLLQNSNLHQLKSLVRHSKVTSLIQTNLNEDQLARLEVSESKSLMLKRKQKDLRREMSLERFREEVQVVLFKSKRQLGEDLALRNHPQMQEEHIRHTLKHSQTVSVAFRHQNPSSTHTYFKQITKHQKNTFVNHKFNASLKQRLDRMKTMFQQSEQVGRIEFKSDFQSGNMELALKVGEDEYNIYLRMDTHTNGHQSWFYFQMINHEDAKRRVKLTICNLKKRLKMITKGQKLFVKRNDQWQQLDEDVQLLQQDKKLYKLRFSITLMPKESLYISLIPPYTYTQLLTHIQEYQKSPNVKVEVLTYSIASLAIPIITITKEAKKQVKTQTITKKKLYLVSGRIHPSQTCSSYIIDGFIRCLLSGTTEMQAFLRTSIIKIVPMLNPDGVVFGNFRTSYLGDDLNRAFHQTDDAVYPEITALKELVKLCKAQFGESFQAFIDMHGHSSRPNSFAYGPDSEQGGDELIEWRTFPKILDKVSKYFCYELSSFKLEEYKINTARGHFLRKYKIPSYTIETSYALYRHKSAPEGELKPMGVPEWSELGGELADALQLYTEYTIFAKRRIANQVIFKKKMKERQEKILRNNRFKISFFELYNQIRQELSHKREKQVQSDQSSSQSDGEPIEQDLPPKQKQTLTRKIKEVFQASYLLPRAMKPSMILPAIVPSIVVITKKDKHDLNVIVPKLSSKMRPKKFARPLNHNSEFNEYLLKNVNGISNLRPDVINFSTLIAKRLKEDAQKQGRNQ